MNRYNIEKTLFTFSDMDSRVLPKPFFSFSKNPIRQFLSVYVLVNKLLVHLVNSKRQHLGYTLFLHGYAV